MMNRVFGKKGECDTVDLSSVDCRGYGKYD